MPQAFDVVVIGGGCVGASSAWHLARLGAGKVLLVESTGLAAGATGRSSAVVRTHYTHEVLARMALRGRHFFENAQEIVGRDCGFDKTGFLALFREEDREVVAENVDMHRGLGIRSDLLSADEVGKLEPRLSLTEVGCAAFEPDSGHADPHATTNAMAEAARQAGAEIRIGVKVTELLTTGDRVTGVNTEKDGPIQAGTVLVAAGYRTKELVERLGFEVPITPMRHTLASIKRTEDFGPKHPIVSDRSLGHYFIPEVGGLTVVGATSADVGYLDTEVEVDRQARPEDTAELAEAFLVRFPGQEGAGVQGSWTGMYDCSPDVQPMLGPIESRPGLYIGVGFSGHGFKLSPVTGELLARSVLGLPTDEIANLEMFRPERFQEGRLIASARSYSVPTLG